VPSKPVKHELVEFENCTLFNSGHAYSHGYDRAVCTCGWKSVCSMNQTALVALFKIHKEEQREAV
jgi:hypothetical protein